MGSRIRSAIFAAMLTIASGVCVADSGTHDGPPGLDMLRDADWLNGGLDIG